MRAIPPRPRLTRRAAAIALAAIVAVGAGGVVFALTHGPAPVGQFASGHDHGTGSSAASGHEHDAAAPVTPTQQSAADALVAATASALAPYAEVAAAEAAGYRWIGDGTTGGDYRHYVNAAYLLDGDILDATHIESLVYRTTDDGSLELVSGMYILPPGDTLADAPDVAGDLTPWHVHTNLCWSRDGIAGTNDSGACPDGSVNAGTPPMLHVWVVDNPDGPFAAIDENGIVSAAAHTH